MTGFRGGIWALRDGTVACFKPVSAMLERGSRSNVAHWLHLAVS
uniref:Uncharacterized protein n=1 Tax=Anguilla anguilla TaxID=7936 RepID=A0A0E9TPV4_ANGAN